MAAPSVLYSVLVGVQRAVQSLGLTLPAATGGAAVPVLVRKLPKVGEVLETCPVIIVSTNGKAEELGWWDFQNLKKRYPILVAMVVAGNRDNVTALDSELNWRERVCAKFAKLGALTSVGRVFDQRVVPDVPIDKAMFADNYDYSAVLVRVTTAEPSS